MGIWTDQSSGGNGVYVDGILYPDRPAINLVSGSGVSLAVTDDPANGRLTITFTAGGSSSAPAFTAFSITGQATTLEVGATVSGASATFTWATSNSANVKPNTVSIVNTTGSTTLASGLANDGTEVLTFTDITNTVAASQVWTISAQNLSLGTFSKTFTVSWLWRVYAGSSANVTLTANQIKALADSSSLQSGFAGTYAINPSSAYSYFCYPDSLGSVAHFVDASTGFPISMATASDNAAYSNTANGWSYALVSVTNAQGVATNYRVYRTQYPFTASPLSMVVS